MINDWSGCKDIYSTKIALNDLLNLSFMKIANTRTFQILKNLSGLVHHTALQENMIQNGLRLRVTIPDPHFISLSRSSLD